MKKHIRRRTPLREPSAELPSVLARIIAAREHGIDAVRPGQLRDMLPVNALSGIDAAAARLADAVTSDERILILGDFDADGATSCALAIDALTQFGATRVDYLVPNRFEYGYGLTPEIVAFAAAQQPDLIITVDNGIASVAGVAAARERGISVVITDHHLPGDVLPAADAIVNPNLKGDPFPSKHLAGVGVIFYLMSALRARLRDLGWFDRSRRREPNLADLLDLVALGTVADVVTLDRNNRILVDQGLRRIRAGRSRPGLDALIAVAQRDRSRLVAADLAFAVAPRLNAAGRLEDMSVGIECLLARDPVQAQALAAELDELNIQRREIEAQMQAEARHVVETLRLGNGAAVPPALCLMDASWHQGVVGIVAGRLKERYHRPVIAFAPAGDGILKGSGRSISGLHLRDTLEAVATAHPGLVERFGGHAMAAGLSLQADRFEAFAKAFVKAVAERVSPDDLEGVIWTDGELGPEDLCLETAELLRDAGPWGHGYPEPVFDGRFEIGDSRIVGRHHVKYSVRVPGTGHWLDAIAFNGVERGWHELHGTVEMAYRLDVNEFRGRRSAQLMVEHIVA